MDPFAAVMGARRGPGEIDTVLSRQPTETARAELDNYLEQLKERNFTKTLATLAEHRGLIEDRPLLHQLAGRFCQYLVSQSALAFDDAVRDFLAATTVYPQESDFLLFGTDLARRNPQQRVGVHIWPDGNTVGPLSCLEGEHSTVCGLRIERAAWRRADRGVWQAEPPTGVSWDRCEACERACPPELQYVMQETTSYIPFGAPLYKNILKAINKRAVAALAAGEFKTVDDAARIANATYGATLLPASVAYAERAGEAAVQRLLDSRQWRSLRREHGQPLHELLGREDWRGALAPVVPRSAPDGTLVAAGPEQLAAVRAHLRHLVVERAQSPMTSGL